MKFSERWLRTLVDPPLDTAALAEKLTMSGLEVESIEPAAPAFEGVVVARIESVAPHPNADRLRVCTVDAGLSERLSVVCGAPNAAAGMTVPCALVGAKLPGGVDIKRTSVRGVESAGMLCSARELGISEDAAGLLALDDALITLKITPNRADCLSLVGIARDVSAVTGAAFIPPPSSVVAVATDARRGVRVDDRQACPRFVSRTIERIDPKAPTPEWMKQRIERSGIRSISAVVDVTNYVMLELGQPLHAYDGAARRGVLESGRDPGQVASAWLHERRRLSLRARRRFRWLRDCRRARNATDPGYLRRARGSARRCSRRAAAACTRAAAPVARRAASRHRRPGRDDRDVPRAPAHSVRARRQRLRRDAAVVAVRSRDRGRPDRGGRAPRRLRRDSCRAVRACAANAAGTRSADRTVPTETTVGRARLPGSDHIQLREQHGRSGAFLRSRRRGGAGDRAQSDREPPRRHAYDAGRGSARRAANQPRAKARARPRVRSGPRVSARQRRVRAADEDRRARLRRRIRRAVGRAEARCRFLRCEARCRGARGAACADNRARGASRAASRTVSASDVGRPSDRLAGRAASAAFEALRISEATNRVRARPRATD